MSKRTISRILASGVFLAWFMIGAQAVAQTAPTTNRPVTGYPGQAAPSAKSGTPHNHPAETNPACQRILSECKKLGFIDGQWKKDNGLWKDCFDPVVKGGGTPTRDGKSINVPVSQNDVQACRAAVEGHHK